MFFILSFSSVMALMSMKTLFRQQGVIKFIKRLVYNDCITKEGYFIIKEDIGNCVK